MKNQIEYLENGIKVNGEFISLVEITKNVNISKSKTQKLGLMIITWDGGRGFDGCQERYVSNIDNLKEIKDILIGKNISFGEIAGKHSDIYGEMEDCDFKIIEDIEKVQEFLSKNPSGHDYDHSFLETFKDCLEYDEDEDISETQKSTFLKLYK